MSSNSFVSRTKRMFAALFVAGTLFSGSCGSDSLRAVVAGIDAATSSLDHSLSSQHLSFGDWLLLGLNN